MEYSVLQSKVDAGFSQRSIACACGVGHTAVRYWLKRFGLKTKPSVVRLTLHCEICALCKRKTKLGRRLCPSCWTRVRRCRTKLLAVKLLGGKCAECGWKGHPAAFDFHHTGGKDFAIGSAANKSWKVIAKELKKCVLLCANCHRVEHARSDEAALLAEAEKYVLKGSIIAKVAQSVVAPV